MSLYHIECKTEECLLFNLGIQPENIEHHPGGGAVCKTLSENNNLIGLVDQDPDADHHPYYKKLYKKPASDKFGVRFCKDETNSNKLIILKPKFEDWIISAATNSRLRMSDFNLSSDPDILHRDILFKIGDLQKLIHQLKKVKSPAMLHIVELINL